MRRQIGRRKFVGLLGAGAVVGTAGCLGDWEADPDGNPGDGSSGGTQVGPAEFDFPKGADDRGAVGETIVAGAEDVLAGADRYRLGIAHKLDATIAGTPETVETTASYDVDGEAVLEEQRRGGADIERWVTPSGTVARADEIDGDRSGRWVADSGQAGAGSSREFRLYPFELSAAAALLESARLDFDGIVGRDGREYARYEGVVDRPERVALPRWTDGRTGYQIVGVNEGRVSTLLAESGALGAVEYDVDATVVRTTHDEDRRLPATARGEVRFAYDGLEGLSEPSWAAERDPGTYHEFAVKALSGPGRVYELTQGPTLPGWTTSEYAEIYAAATVGNDRYVDRYRRPEDFEVGDRLYVGYRADEGELTVSPSSISGRNALEHADRVELSVYLWNPTDGRAPIYHDAFYPNRD